MAYIGLSIFFICCIIYCIYFKADLYIHQHDSAINKELDAFNSNFEAIKTLDGDISNFRKSDSHLYEQKKPVNTDFLTIY